ncbi:MAG: hypothetical protein QM689_00210 [Oscillospiraceae bacterium]
MRNETLNQWDEAAPHYFSSQQDSGFVKVNKCVVQRRFEKLENEKVLDMGISPTISDLSAAMLSAVMARKGCYPLRGNNIRFAYLNTPTLKNLLLILLMNMILFFAIRC